MIVQLLVAIGLTGVTVILHALGTIEAMAQLARAQQQGHVKPGVIACEARLLRMVVVLLLLHLVESAVWAGYFFMSGLLPDMETSLYFSLTCYTTVGFGDVVLPVQSRLLGPIEGAVGILTFGWSTAIMVAAIPRIYRRRLQLHSDARGDGNVA